MPDSKTGARIVHLGDPAIAVLRGIQCREDSPWVRIFRDCLRTGPDLGVSFVPTPQL